jgi:hypothetical protein
LNHESTAIAFLFINGPLTRIYSETARPGGNTRGVRFIDYSTIRKELTSPTFMGARLRKHSRLLGASWEGRKRVAALRKAGQMRFEAYQRKWRANRPSKTALPDRLIRTSRQAGSSPDFRFFDPVGTSALRYCEISSCAITPLPPGLRSR